MIKNKMKVNPADHRYLEDIKAKKRLMDKPEDVLRKISHSYIGETVHEYFGLPGKFEHNIENEFPDKDGREMRTDGAYIVEDDGKKLIINIEDESSIVNEETLAKTYGYCVNMEYAYNLPVYSVITTPIPLNKCTNTYWPSKTLKYIPHIISFNELDGNKKLEYAMSKINEDKCFSNLEAYDLINIPKMFNENNEEVLEEVCNLFSKMKMEKKIDKFKLGKGLECVINKYGKSTDDIKRLTDMINMTKVSEDVRQIVREVYKDEIDEERMKVKEERMKVKEERMKVKEERMKVKEERMKAEKEREKRIDLARKFAEKLSIEEVVEISGLSKEQILNKP